MIKQRLICGAMLKTLKTGIVFIFLLLIVFVSCKQNNSKSVSVSDTIELDIDSSTFLMNYNNSVFNIPSPYQTTLLLKKEQHQFNNELIQYNIKIDEYATIFKKALNLGVLGANLGYLTIYEQPNEAIKYVSYMKTLAEDLGFINLIEDQLGSHPEKYIENLDSLQKIISATYRNINAYLADNEQSYIGALIITGSWVEGMYLATQHSKLRKSYSLTNRIGEQKVVLENLIDLLSPYYYLDANFTTLVDTLVDLAYEFDGIIFNYQHMSSTDFPDERLTIIHGETNVIISEHHTNTITNKISELRNTIIN